jgi:hypothetical protein
MHCLGSMRVLPIYSVLRTEYSGCTIHPCRPLIKDFPTRAWPLVSGSWHLCVTHPRRLSLARNDDDACNVGSLSSSPALIRTCPGARLCHRVSHQLLPTPPRFLRVQPESSTVGTHIVYRAVSTLRVAIHPPHACMCGAPYGVGSG